MTPSRPAPVRRSRVAWLSAGFGAAVLVSSLVVAALALRSRAEDTSSGGSTPAPPPLSEVAAVAIGYVDVEHGVTPVLPLQSGRVTAIDAAEGVNVAAGMPLFHLDDKDARLQADAARAALAAAKVRRDQARQAKGEHDDLVKAQEAAVQSAQAAGRAAEIQYEQTRRRGENKAVTEEDVRTAEQVVTRAKAAQRGEEARLAALKAQDPELGVRLAEEDVAAKEAELKRAQQAVDECVVKAPFDGTPLRVLLSVGEVAGPQSRQPALWFCPKGLRIIRAEVEQEFAGRIEKLKDQPVRIEDDATGQGSWTGHVRRIGDWYTQRRSVMHEPLQFNDVRTLECIVTVDPDKDGQPHLLIGQRVRVNFLKSPQAK
jgi:multidrug resistance efflux pump